MRRKVVNKRKFIKSILITIFMIVVMFICISSVFADNEKVETTEITYTVSKGETLWNIAKKFKQENQDIRDYIYKVEKLNNMTSATIYEGQVITIIK